MDTAAAFGLSRQSFYEIQDNMEREGGAVVRLGDADAAEEPAWIGQREVLLTKRALTDREAETLPRTALWQVLRELDDVADARWLTLLARHPMPLLVALAHAPGLQLEAR